MRVIGGEARGRRLTAPAGRAVRPTSDRVREALFSSLSEVIPGAVVLDCYAGSGAVGIEALSRGAAAAVLVEQDRRVADVAASNVRSVGMTSRMQLHRTDAVRFCRQPTGGPFDVVFFDPPYTVPLADLYDRVTDLRSAGALAAGARVVIERGKHDPGLDAEPPAFLAFERRRSYGDTVLISFTYDESVPR